MPKTVWIIQENPNVNYKPAEEWGELEIVLNSNDGPGYLKGKDRPKPWTEAIEQMADNINTLFDRLVLTGNPLFIGYAIHCVLAKHRECPVLIWDRRNREYNPFTLKDGSNA